MTVMILQTTGAMIYRPQGCHFLPVAVVTGNSEMWLLKVDKAN